jgi:hypothetical protein
MIGESVTMSNSRERARKFFELACQYKNAADLLSERFESGTTNLSNLPIREPIYFLYHHATELVLKAFLTSHSKRTSSSHDIEGLYEASRKEGLIVKEDHAFEVHNLIHLLAAGNQGHFYRYPVENKRISSHSAWTRDVVGRLVEAVAPSAKSNAPLPSTRRIYFGKPVITKQPVPYS